MKIHRNVHVPQPRVDRTDVSRSGTMQALKRPGVGGDGFEAPRARPMDLCTPGKQNNAQFVTDLYRNLLGREPDAEGMKAHLDGLAKGATRDDVTRAFTSSPEFKQRLGGIDNHIEQMRQQAVSMLGPAPAASQGQPASATESFKALIKADMKAAYGREATEQDYAYWMPKLQGPNDSSLVTSGKMSATEYWHERMLGWQAGGSDQATMGPYAGSSEAHGPVPSATDMVPGVPPDSGVAVPGGALPPQLEQQFRYLIAADIRFAGGREATQEDFNYWLPKLAGGCDSGFVSSGQMSSTEYWHRRMLGWQAGGSDMALRGPYAGSPEARGPVPPAESLIGQTPW